jgi:hypothetical protein
VATSKRILKSEGNSSQTPRAQRGRDATKNSEYLSRKGAKAAKKLNFRTWRSWRLGGSNSPGVWQFSAMELLELLQVLELLQLLELVQR